MQSRGYAARILNLVHHKMTCNSSVKTLTSSLRFSLLKNDLKELLDILESLQFSLQPIFELTLNIPLGYIYEKVPWSWVKILTKLGQNFTKCFVSWPYVHKIITWDPRIFGRICLKKSFRFHGYLQLSCWKFLLNHLASWWKFGSKLWKKYEISNT